MESPTPLPSTPLSGVAPRVKWIFQSCSPDMQAEGHLVVRKKLFDLENQDTPTDGDDKHWGSSSDYFSQSTDGIDASCSSMNESTNLFDENSPPKQVPLFKIADKIAVVLSYCPTKIHIIPLPCHRNHTQVS